MDLGPDTARLIVRTGRGGAAAKAGHDLVLEVTRWSARLDEDSAELTADARSLRVRSGSGGISPLGDEERAGIAQTIDDEVLKGTAIAFRSTSVTRDGDSVEVDKQQVQAFIQQQINGGSGSSAASARSSADFGVPVGVYNASGTGSTASAAFRLDDPPVQQRPATFEPLADGGVGCVN